MGTAARLAAIGMADKGRITIYSSVRKFFDSISENFALKAWTFIQVARFKIQTKYESY